MLTDIAPLEEAARARKQVTLNYSKETDGSTVTHTIGIQEIGQTKAGKPCIWGWDTTLNDHIRAFLLSNIINAEVIDVDYIPSGVYPIKINGQIV